MLNLIYCIDNNGLFGRKNELPWYFKEDLKYFKDITTNFNKKKEENVIVMGYNTWISIKKKLPNRTNVVITSKNKEYITNQPDYIYNSFDKFIEDCKKNKIFYNRNIFIIGGKQLLLNVVNKYNKFINHIFMNVIDNSFLKFYDDVTFQIESFNLEICKLSSNTIYCLNILDNKYYHIKFNHFINKNFNINNVINFTENINLINDNRRISIPLINHNHNNYNQYNILEDVKDVPLQFCNDCNSIIKQPLKYSKDMSYVSCNECIKTKCKCLFC